jgi:hypothetical protein
MKDPGLLGREVHTVGDCEQIFQFNLGGEEVLIAITIQCPKLETEQTVNPLAERLWAVGQPMILRQEV